MRITPSPPAFLQQMTTKIQTLRKYAPFINKVIAKMYKGLGFSVRLKSGKTGFKLLTKRHKKGEDSELAGQIITERNIKARLESKDFCYSNLWTVLYELELVKKNTNENNFQEKVKEFYKEGKISAETFTALSGWIMPGISYRERMLKTLSELKDMARRKNIVYVRFTAAKFEPIPFETYVHEKLHEACRKICDFRNIDDEHAYIHLVALHILNNLIRLSSGEFQKYLKEDLEKYLNNEMILQLWKSEVSKIVELYKKGAISEAEMNEIMAVRDTMSLIAVMDRIIDGHRQ